MTTLKIRHYDSFNFRRFSNPWIAVMNEDKPDFTKRAGGYTGSYNKGEEGDLYITDPAEGTVYMYGQKDYRGNGTKNGYCKIANGKAIECNKLGEI